MIEDHEFRELITASEVYQNFESIKKSIMIKMPNIKRLKIYYDQSQRYGLDYIKGNPNVTSSDIKLIQSIL